MADPLLPCWLSASSPAPSPPPDARKPWHFGMCYVQTDQGYIFSRLFFPIYWSHRHAAPARPNFLSVPFPLPQPPACLASQSSFSSTGITSGSRESEVALSRTELCPSCSPAIPAAAGTQAVPSSPMPSPCSPSLRTRPLGQAAPGHSVQPHQLLVLLLFLRNAAKNPNFAFCQGLENWAGQTCSRGQSKALTEEKKTRKQSKQNQSHTIKYLLRNKGGFFSSCVRNTLKQVPFQRFKSYIKW